MLLREGKIKFQTSCLRGVPAVGLKEARGSLLSGLKKPMKFGQGMAS
jgi:hypothetical protein